MTGEVETGSETLLADAGPTEDAALAAAFDRVAVNNGADRGTDGKFTSPGDAGDAKPGDSSTPADGEGAGAETPSPVAAVPAPAHLPQAIKAHWDKYGPEAQAAIATHQAEMDRKFGEVGKQLGLVKPVADKLNDAIQKFPEFRGMTPEALAQGAFELATIRVSLDQKPVETLMQIAQHYKVLPQLAEMIGKGGQPQGDASRLEAEIIDLKKRLNTAANPDTIREQISRTMQEKDAETAVLSFAEGKEFYGEVEAYLPHFVGMVIESGGRDRPYGDILSDAYDMAINALPEVRAKMRAAEAKATAATADPKAVAAKKAASINVPSTTTGKERQLSEDELLALAYDRRMAS